MEPSRCPGCGGAALIVGHMIAGQGVGCSFRPPNCRGGVLPKDVFRACLACGHLWSVVDQRWLRTVIATQGNELARQHLDEIDRGPCRDLPDTEAAREIGAKVAEMDAKARLGPPAAARKYRELLGVTWDDALREARRWPDLTREEKLEAFGWAPKEKPDEDFDSPFH